jgi:hypothetical protein
VVIVVGSDEDQPRITAERIFATFANPFLVGVNQHLCGAKQAGRRQIVRHTGAITERYDRRVQLEHDLQFALQNDEMESV